LASEQEEQYIVIVFHHSTLEGFDPIDNMLIDRCGVLTKQGDMTTLIRPINGRNRVICQGLVEQVIRDTPDEFEVELQSGQRLVVNKDSEYFDVTLEGPEYNPLL
jgi:hypothetical protein